MGKIQGLKVEADALLDEAFTNSPENYGVCHGRAEKTQGESGVSSVENTQSLKVWMATLGKRSSSQTDSHAALGSLCNFKALIWSYKKETQQKKVHSIHVLAAKVTAAKR